MEGLGESGGGGGGGGEGGDSGGGEGAFSIHLHARSPSSTFAPHAQESVLRSTSSFLVQFTKRFSKESNLSRPAREVR